MDNFKDEPQWSIKDKNHSPKFEPKSQQLMGLLWGISVQMTSSCGMEGHGYNHANGVSKWHRIHPTLVYPEHPISVSIDGDNRVLGKAACWKAFLQEYSRQTTHQWPKRKHNCASVEFA